MFKVFIYSSVLQEKERGYAESFCTIIIKKKVKNTNCNFFIAEVLINDYLLDLRICEAKKKKNDED